MECKKGFVKNIALTAQDDDAGRRLDRILRKALPDFPLSALHRALRKGQVLVNGRKGKGEDRVSAGTLIEIPLAKTVTLPYQNKLPLHKQQLDKTGILWEGEGLLIINKPAGLAVHVHAGAVFRDNLDNQVQEYFKGKLPASLSFKPGPLHRLDKPTSGIVVFAFTLEAARWFSTLLRERKIKKRYLAILEGKLKNKETWEDMLLRDKKARKTLIARKDNGKKGLTMVTPLAWAKKSGADYTFARLDIVTGRNHQIRAQAAYHGYPLAEDKKYGGRNNEVCFDKSVCKGRGFFLHAAELELPGETDINPNIPRIIKAPLPGKFAKTVQVLFNIEVF